MKAPSLRFVFSVLMILAVVILWSTLDWVLSKHTLHMQDPEIIVHHDGRAMTARDHLLTVRYPEERVSPVTFFLLSRPTKSLWATLYILAGIAGWCGSVWLRMLQGKADGEAFLPSLLLGGLAGLVTFLLVTIVARFVPGLSDLRGELSVVAIAGGLFVSTFYQELESLLKALFEWLRRKLGGNSTPPKEKEKEKEKPKTDPNDQVPRIAALTLSTLLAIGADAATLYQCTDPKTPVCTASSEEGKIKCPHKCNTWIETSLTSDWLAALQTSEPKSVAANWFLASASASLFGADLFEGAPPKVRVVWDKPGDFGLKTVKKQDIEAGTLVLLPNLTAVVTETAADPLDSMVVYPSATMNGKPNRERLRVLVGQSAPKFVLPEGVINEASAPPQE